MKQPDKNDEIAEEISEEALDQHNSKQEKLKEPEPEDYKEFFSLKTGSFEMVLASNSRPLEYLCEVALIMKDRINENGKSKPGGSYIN